MSKQDKAVERLIAKPTDFTWHELVSLMIGFGYDLKTTGGSGRKFIHRDTRATHFIHEPHPRKVLKPYQVRDLIAFLIDTGQIS